MEEVKHCLICLDGETPATLHCPHVTETGNGCSFAAHEQCYLRWQETRALNMLDGPTPQANCFYNHPLGLDFSMEVRCRPMQVFGINISRSVLALLMHVFYLEVGARLPGLCIYTLATPLWLLFLPREEKDPGLVYALVLSMAQAAVALPSLVFSANTGRYHTAVVASYICCLEVIQVFVMRRLGLRGQEISRCIWSCMSIGIMSTMIWHLALSVLLNGLLGIGLGMDALTTWIARVVTLRMFASSDESYLQYLHSGRWPGITQHLQPNTLAVIHSKLTLARQH